MQLGENSQGTISVPQTAKNVYAVEQMLEGLYNACMQEMEDVMKAISAAQERRDELEIIISSCRAGLEQLRTNAEQAGKMVQAEDMSGPAASPNRGWS